MDDLAKKNDRLLSQPLYSWDARIMLSGVVNFLEFSEENLSSQRIIEVDKAKAEGDSTVFNSGNQHLESSYKSQLIEAAEYRFDVLLSQTVRYGGITSFITAIELCANVFEKSLLVESTKKPSKMNKQIHLLSFLDSKTNGRFKKEIEDISNLINVRNCIAHWAGLINHYKYKEQLMSSLKSLNGFHTWNDNFLGENIHIKKGAIEIYADQAALWIPKLHEDSVNAGIISNKWG